MLAAAFPKASIASLAWVALAPLILAARGARSARAAAGYGLLAGCLFFSILIEWIRLFDAAAWVAATLLQAAFIALFAALVRAISPSPRGWRGAVVPAILWTAIEWVRSLGPMGFTWGGLAYSQHPNVPLVQVVSLAGASGLTFLIALVNSAVAGLVARRQNPWRERAAPLAAAAAAVLVCWVWGWWRLAQPLPGGERVRVAVLQGSLGDEGNRFAPAPQRDYARVYLGLTEAAARRGATLVIWPESAIPGGLVRDPNLRDVRTAITGAARRLGVDLVVGSAHAGPRGSLNSAFLIGKDGRIAGRYDKVHLVPYGEYTPLREPLDFIYRHFPVIDHEFSPGQGFHPLRASASPLGVAICFESAFPGIARALRRQGARFLAVITNDAWFGTRSATWQHYQMARFRAIENGCYLLRAATTGFSAILDPYGRVVQETRLFDRTLLVADVTLLPRPTPYARVGDVVAWACALAALWLIAARRKG